MGKIKTGLTGWGRMLVYPLLRPAQDISQSVRSVREAARTAREERQQRREAAGEVSKVLEGHTPQEKFEQAFAAWGWTEDALAAQMVAARRTRLAALATGLAGFLGVLGLMLFLHGWILMMLAAVAIVMPVGGVLQGLRFAWWEYAIETRSLTPMRAFLSRPDLLERLFSMKGPVL